MTFFLSSIPVAVLVCALLALAYIVGHERGRIHGHREAKGARR